MTRLGCILIVVSGLLTIACNRQRLAHLNLGELQGGDTEWSWHMDSVCIENKFCVTDGCGGAWPTSQCTLHEARIETAGVNKNRCVQNQPATTGFLCKEKIAQATCPTVQGHVEVDPIIRTTSARPLDSARESLLTLGAIDFPRRLIV